MMSKADDNRSNQLNDNNDAYYRSRGHSGRPDEDEDCGGSYIASALPPQKPTLKDEFIARTAVKAIANHTKRLSTDPCFALCDFLMKSHPYFIYKNMGHNSAVIVHVLDCKASSEDARFILSLAESWRGELRANDTLTVFKIEFHSAD